MRAGGIVLCCCGKTCGEKYKHKSRNQKSASCHSLLRSLTRGSLRLSCRSESIAQAADFAGLLAWRCCRLAAFPQRCPSCRREGENERLAAVACELLFRLTVARRRRLVQSRTDRPSSRARSPRCLWGARAPARSDSSATRFPARQGNNRKSIYVPGRTLTRGRPDAPS